MSVNPLPVALNDRGLRLKDDIVRMELRQTAVELLRSQFLRDTIKPQNLMSCGFQHGRRRRRHDREYVRGAGEPLELPVLGKKRNPFLARQRRIAYRNSHPVPRPLIDTIRSYHL